MQNETVGGKSLKKWPEHQWAVGQCQEAWYLCHCSSQIGNTQCMQTIVCFSCALCMNWQCRGDSVLWSPQKDPTSPGPRYFSGHQRPTGEMNSEASPPQDIQAFSMAFPSQACLSEVDPSPRTWSHWVRWWRSLLPPLSPGTKARAWEAPHSKVQPQNILGSESLTFGFLGPETSGITALRGLRLNPKPGFLCDNSVENKGIQNYKGLTHRYS